MENIFLQSYIYPKILFTDLRMFRILTIVVLTLSFANVVPQAKLRPSSQKLGTIKVLVSGFDSNTGLVKVGLDNSREIYKKNGKSYRYASAPINSNQAVCVFSELPPGEYAIRLYHDVHENNKLDFNFLGMPKEKFGFSNNAKVRFGPPKYDKVKFALEAEEKTINITLQ